MWSKSRLRVVGFSSAVALLLLYFVARDDEPSRVRVAVDRLKLALAYDSSRESPGDRRTRLEREIEASAEPDVRLNIPETSRVLSGRAAVAEFIANVGDLRRLELGISDVVVGFDDSKQTAHLTARVAVDAWRSDYESHQVRNASIRLARHEHGWRISSVTIAHRTHEEPEARP